MFKRNRNRLPSNDGMPSANSPRADTGSRLLYKEVLHRVVAVLQGRVLVIRPEDPRLFPKCPCCGAPQTVYLGVLAEGGAEYVQHARLLVPAEAGPAEAKETA